MSNLLAQNWWAIALRGVFAIVFGIIALFMPGAALLALVLTWWMAAYALFFGVALIVLAFRLRGRRYVVPPQGAVPRGV